MWCRLIAVLAAVSLAAGDEDGVPGIPGGIRGFIEPRLAASAMRLGRIERELGEVHDRIVEAKKVDPEGFLNDLNDRIDHVEAIKDHCDSNRELRCGQDTMECVNTLLLCDGQKDCHNGWDESAKTCSSGPAKAGNIFTGTAHWSACTNHNDHPIQLTITGTYTAKFFGARIGVTGIVSVDFNDDGEKEHTDVDVKGYYTFGRKRLVLFPKSGLAQREHLGVLCDFVHGNDSTAECRLTHEGSLLDCAKFHAVLQ